jgi:hypothetical protein
MIILPKFRRLRMPRIYLSGFILSSAAIAYALSFGEPAQACSDLPNICEQQRLQQEQNNEYFRQQEEEYFRQQQEQQQQQQSENSSYSPPPQRSYDPMEAKVNYAYSLFQLFALKQQQLLEDPLYRKYLDGSWDFFQDAKEPKPGEYCVALFYRKGTILTLSGPGGDYKGALLSFWGQDIPRPKKLETVKVTLTQSNEPAQSVKALNYAVPGSEFGTISFVVPTIEAALAGIEDVQSFDVAIEGKLVAQIEWHSGLAARENLRKCLSTRSKRLKH